ncbi:TetR family transcriptional regulator [Ornithinibacillus sp. L9]|uniref:TetR family transcriptional regulator n=1 Tax=Ornithinibacillus caprae TaxID=2678566 RepID=A0A6N8FL31_9BACI|nr:TetR family transcriptional regulator [Ornithinibacillus caprae]MUK90350.1 TetR family transcriptional regulator [Ornithinibacillus caprae]
MNILDQNNISAREYIICAFMDLLEIKRFEQISVKEIVKKAGISRSTFYLHFHDKYELMEKVRESITSTFLSFYDTDRIVKATLPSINNTTYKLCEHVYQYRSFYKYEFEKAEYIQNLSDALALKLMKVYPEKSYAIFASFGTIGYLKFWVEDKFSISTEDAAKQLMNIGKTNWSKYNLI